MRWARRPAFRSWRRSTIVALLTVLAAVAGIRIALPASADPGDPVCNFVSSGGGCLFPTWTPTHTNFRGYVRDNEADEMWTELAILVHRDSSGWSYEAFYTAHWPDLPRVQINHTAGGMVTMYKSQVCRVSSVDGERDCKESREQPL